MFMYTRAYTSVFIYVCIYTHEPKMCVREKVGEEERQIKYWGGREGDKETGVGEKE